MGPGASVVKVRDTFVPIIDVGQRLGFRRKSPPGSDCVAILVESETGGRHALLVDAIQDQRQVVIKSLETNYGSIDGIAAATILGDGRVALILDVDAAVCQSHPRRDFQSMSTEHDSGVTLQ
jgi:two-component system chemotaxis sensor kinase CheA